MELAKQQQCCVRSPRWRPGEEVVTVTLGKLLVGAALLSVVTALVPSALAVERPDDRAGLGHLAGGEDLGGIVGRVMDRRHPEGQ